jgi:hypothetical protein
MRDRRRGPAAVASKVLSGFLVAEARVLLVTITSDDLDWARDTWLSIREHPAQGPGRRPDHLRDHLDGAA